MTKLLSDVSVGKVSLVTSVHNPAVAKASTTFSIFKMFQKNKVSREAIAKIESIQRALRIDDIKAHE